MSKVLLVEDDNNLLDVLNYNLLNEGYTVITAKDGFRAVELAHNEKPDLIILDVMLPGLDGFEVCRILRKEMATLVIMLTAKDDEVDRIVGLEVGADDYMTKPFSMRELLARIRAILRRSSWIENNMDAVNDKKHAVLKSDEIEIDLEGHKTFYKGTELKLSPKEFDLLSYLVTNHGKVFSREQLIEKIWSFDYEGTARTVDVHIRSLRQKIEPDPDNPVHLLTVYGYGYKFD